MKKYPLTCGFSARRKTKIWSARKASYLNVLSRTYIQEHYPRVWARLQAQATRLANADKVIESVDAELEASNG